MPKIALQYPLLILDTSSRRTWVGLKLAADQLLTRSEEQDPSKTLFRLVEATLAEAGLSLEKLAAIAFCAGPGSMLGARTTSMAIRSWKGIGIPAAQQVFYYNCLQIGAILAANSPACGERGLVVTDARRSSWNALPFPSEASQDLSLVDNAELENLDAEIVTFQEFPSWTKTAAKLVPINYDPTPVFEQETFLPLLQPSDQAAPLTIRHNEYKRWEPKIHSAPEQ